ncbi:nucleotide disphospho-sugar-binding domain-containing protein [Streptomyces sp. NPDC052040]|uniref:nucleotide disphospho-sugar-binding domain-containing protein n=1 Tax=Streptomyces sp. NPDC052040 TaxID=3365682 RepID=UPI0037D4E623
MRALFITWPWGSHLYPMTPFGWALRAAGHDVVVAAQPAFASTITQAGLVALPVGEDVDVKGQLRRAHQHDSLDRTAIEHRGAAAVQAATDSAIAIAEDTYRFAAHWRPDFVVYEPMAYLGPGIARDLAIPALRLLWATDFLASVTDFGPTGEELLGGLTTRRELQESNAFGDLTLDPCPPQLQVAADLPRQGMRYVPYNGPAQLPHRLRTPPQRPRVVVTWGGSLHHLGWQRAFLAPRIVAALAGRDIEVVVAVLDEQRDSFTCLPDNVIHVGPVALNLLLPGCAAIIHQGGAGTTMTAVSYGVPQLILAWAADAIVNAGQVEATGSGRRLRPDDLDDAGLADALEEFLGGLAGHQECADDLLRAHLALPTPAEVTTQLAHDFQHATGVWTNFGKQTASNRRESGDHDGEARRRHSVVSDEQAGAV